MTSPIQPHRPKLGLSLLLGAAALLVLWAVVWQALTLAGMPNPTAAHTSPWAATVEIGLLVFREGLECVLVLAAITASMTRTSESYRRPIALGGSIALIATLATWLLLVGIIDQLRPHFSLLDLQAATGLLAIVVLLVVMNWFFHKVYWTGWIALHTKRKRKLTDMAGESSVTRDRVLLGFAILGFTSVYREGFEVVLFLQTYLLQVGPGAVGGGVVIGLIFTAVVAVLTFIAQQRLPYKKMLVLTGVLLTVVLLVMVGEQVQEMQLAHWIPETTLPSLARITPAWMGLWFSVFPNVETLGAQAVAAALVLGSYAVSRRQSMRLAA